MIMRNTPGPVRPPQNDDPDAWVRFWLDSALRCPAFHWDADQRELAEDALREAIAKAEATFLQRFKALMRRLFHDPRTREQVSEDQQF